MIFKYKTLLVPAILTALSGCGGNSSDSDNQYVKNGNVAPTLDVQALESTYSTTYTNDQGDLEWVFNFQESDEQWDNPQSQLTEKVDFYEIDLLTGIVDPDISDNLTVKDVTFMWRGADCSNTITTAPDYPDLCFPILEKLGLMEDDGEGGRKPINTTFDDEEEIRKEQNLPLYSKIIYGFELKQDSLKVTPNMFAPLLLTGQTAELGIIYNVTDGEATISRRVKVIVNGDDSAPEFYEQDEYGDLVLTSDGERIPVDVSSGSASEKEEPVTFNLLEGIFDQDRYDVAELEEEIGLLENFYNQQSENDFTRDIISVHSFSPPGDIIDGTWETTTKWREGLGLTEYNLVIDPSTYAEELAKGEDKVLTFTYVVSDGNNDVERSFEFTIRGANLKNAPEFSEANVTSVIQTNDKIQTVSLLEGVSDPEGDQMIIVDLVGPTTNEFGYDDSTMLDNGNIKIDPYFFTYLKAGETKDFVYTYKVSDGELVSEERTYTVQLVGGNSNLAANGVNSDHDLEGNSSIITHGSAVFGETDGPFYWQWSGANNGNANGELSITSEAAHSGSFGLDGNDDNMFIRLGVNGIKQGSILKGDSFYLNYFAKTDGAWANINNIFNEEGVWNDTLLEKVTQSLGTTDWAERTVTVDDADEFFTEDSTFDITFHGGRYDMDDVSIVKYSYNADRDLVEEGSFDLETTGGWQVSDGALLEVLEEANRFQNTDGIEYGLKVTGHNDNTTELYLDSSVFPQGAIKKGMRYIIEFDLRDQGFVSGSPAAIHAMVKDEASANISRRLTYAYATTSWSKYHLHINTVSDGSDFKGMVNTDVNFDWESATTRLAIEIPAGKTFYIDNIRVYPVPQ